MFNKIILLLILISSIAFASLENIEASPSSIKNIKVIDIRTPAEWRETGIIKGSYPIMFFNEKGEYDINKFVSKLNKIVKKGEKFAIICRTGSRTSVIAEFFSNKLGYNLINLKGGIMNLISKYHYRLTPFKG
ncbi:hypothetical protein MNB_SV-15-707 [hydrothermal vent metagenome]|uniref:Rhodanese domain-containing protein n=1 Tax=hydrothermal vent metagenome TaxID=652676 RepID=A0A1W1EIH2_9ZZZZ